METTVVPYREEFKTAFERLNREWIETYFAMEDADRKVLGDPQREILDRGGDILAVLEPAIRLLRNTALCGCR